MLPRKMLNMNEFFRKQPKLPQNCPSSKVDNEDFFFFSNLTSLDIFLLTTIRGLLLVDFVPSVLRKI